MGSWKIGKLFGIGVYVHWTFLLLPVLVFAMAPPESLLHAFLHMGLILALFTCVVLHEFGHVLAARAFRIGTRDVTLYPIGGVARLERMTKKPVEEILIALAGPAVNVALAILMGIFLCFGLIFDQQLLHEPSLAVQVLLWLMGMNIIMVLFNMIPAFPMDGGRVFRALLAIPLGRLQATRIAAWVTTMIALVGGFFGSYLSPTLPIVAVFIFFMAQLELRAVEMEARREQARPDVPIHAKPIPVAEGWPVFTMKPAVTVYVWDNEAGVWVKQRSGPNS
jgi:Zn-dependent protease